MKLTPSEPDLKTIVQRIDNEDIDLQPDFQRQEVWSTSKKRRLIDSVLRGWSIPPVHLVETTDSRLEVLDGQQRLSSLRDFVHNKFSIDGRITPVDPQIQALHGKFYRQLDPAVRRRIEQYPLRCFKITDYAPEEPSELFYRLNQPTALTAGEQRNALFGPARQQLKTLVSLFESGGNDKSSLGFSNARLAYDDIMARLLFFIEQKTIGIKGTETRVSERFRQRDPFADLVFERASNAIQSFSAARIASTPYRFNKASVLSWVLFYSRFDVPLTTTSAIKTFVDVSQKRINSHYVLEAEAVFQDRSSLRVTDVSSVIYRDFVLWYVYYFTQGGDIPSSVNISVVREVEDALTQRGDVTFNYVLDHSLNIDAWGSFL